MQNLHTWLQVGRFFKIKDRKSTFFTEIRAGTITFVTVGRTTCSLGLWFYAIVYRFSISAAQTAYILVVNALLLSDTGGSCSEQNCTVSCCYCLICKTSRCGLTGAFLQGPLAGNPACVYPDINGATDPGYLACMVRCTLAS